MDVTLDTPVDALKGVGPARAASLARAGILRVGDLLYLVPARYRERLAPGPIGGLVAATEAAIVGEVRATRAGRRFARPSVSKVTVADESGETDVLFFNQPHASRAFRRGDVCFFQGKVVERSGRKSLVAAHWERAEELRRTTIDGPPARIPQYELPEGVPPRLFRRLVGEALPLAGDLPDWRVRAGLAADGLLDLAEAVRGLHRPSAAASLDAARRRLAYEEFFRVLLPLLHRRGRRSAGRAIVGVEAHADAVVAALPFAPTGAQRRAVDEIRRDLAAPVRMHRLLHGDVGSGKTAVAWTA
ncbi:MAG: OB-fold nucleic acid binding domain-containing protein, partial [Planctomycetota bacterium JB042]